MTREEQINRAREEHPRMKDISDPGDIGLYRCAFKDGAVWSDNNPDQERISKFTSNLMDENLKLTKKLKIAVEALIAIKDNCSDDIKIIKEALAKIE